MDKKNDTDEKQVVTDSEIPMPAQIQAFAAKLGEEVGQKFTCYIYRVVRDEETGKVKRPFVKKYEGIEPDPSEIAERFRCGTYAVQFIWRIKGQQHNKAYTLEVDQEAFPVLPKGDKSLMPYQGMSTGSMSESMQLQLATIHEISDVMKTAYSSGNAGNGQNIRSPGQSDPMDMFTGLMETMESSFARAMSIQSKIMERVFTRNMERQYGLAEEIMPAQQAITQEDSGIVGKYAPVVREVVDGIKTVIGFFGENVPSEIVKKVKQEPRFQSLLKDQKALVVIGQALRKEFGDKRASDLMNTFGVRMVIKDQKPQEIAQTPIPASIKARGTSIKEKATDSTINNKGVLNAKETGKKGLLK
jgi:hypothetical protein